MVEVVHEPIYDEQAEMPPADFCGFGLDLRACGTHTPDFSNLPIDCKCHTMHGMVTVHHICQFSSTLTWINVFKRSSSNPEGLSERGLSLMSKRSSLKRENRFLAVLSPMALSPYAAQIFQAASAAFALY